MMEFNATSIALAIVATGQIVLGCVLYLQGRKNLSNLFFAATSILIGTWIGVHEARFFYYTRIGHSVPPFWFSKISLALFSSLSLRGPAGAAAISICYNGRLLRPFRTRNDNYSNLTFKNRLFPSWIK